MKNLPPLLEATWPSLWIGGRAGIACGAEQVASARTPAAGLRRRSATDASGDAPPSPMLGRPSLISAIATGAEPLASTGWAVRPRAWEMASASHPNRVAAH